MKSTLSLRDVDDPRRKTRRKRNISIDAKLRFSWKQTTCSGAFPFLSFALTKNNRFLDNRGNVSKIG